MNLISLMSERNLLVDIINALQFQKITSDIKVYEFNILFSKFVSKLAILNKKLGKEAAGLNCGVCNKILKSSDPVIACLSCGIPFHYDHYFNVIKETEYCPICGEFFNLIIYDENLVYFDQQILKSSEEALKIEFPKLEILIRGRIIQEGKKGIVKESICPECKRKINPNWIFCKYCGTRVKSTEHGKSKSPTQQVHNYMKCPRCGNQVSSNWRYCKWCGVTLG